MAYKNELLNKKAFVAPHEDAPKPKTMSNGLPEGDTRFKNLDHSIEYGSSAEILPNGRGPYGFQMPCTGDPMLLGGTDTGKPFKKVWIIWEGRGVTVFYDRAYGYLLKEISSPKRSLALANSLGDQGTLDLASLVKLGFRLKEV